MSETEVNQADEIEVPAIDVADTDETADCVEDAEAAESCNVEPALLRKIVEGVLLAAGQPLSLSKIGEVFIDPETQSVAANKEELLTALHQIQADCEGRGFELVEVGSGWRIQVRAETAPWVNRLWDEKPQKYSRALLETLSLIAYRQPITRGDIEEIRGVAVSSHIVKTLSERDWIKVVGHRDVPGRPSLYATTRQFLDYFNLKSLDELPSLSELRDLEQINAELDLDFESSAEVDEADAIAEVTAELEEQDQHLQDDNPNESLDLDFAAAASDELATAANDLAADLDGDELAEPTFEQDVADIDTELDSTSAIEAEDATPDLEENPGQ